eukprot:Seg625.4 transcript_id=Seg625.4/GoldUCD/mRNA.D3Y31 product="hypothetical protein" protein_id=Seg625.4/GoldUCD/D3Y31
MILTGNDHVVPSQKDHRPLLFKFLMLDSIRHKMKDYKIITPVHKVISNDVSLTCSRDLMTLLNRSGLKYSYTKDLKDSDLARKLWVSFGLPNTLNTVPSNQHWVEMDNLETMLKCTTIHNAERLTHFLTSQLEYIAGRNVILDLYKQPEQHHIDKNFCNLTQIEKDMLSSFFAVCLERCEEVKNYLNCDQVVEAIAETMSTDNRHIVPIQYDETKSPSVRVLTAEEPPPKSSTVYLRMDQLCSNSLLDVKKFLDLMAGDYGLNELKYIQNISATPLLCVSPTFNANLIMRTSHASPQSFSPIFFSEWGFVDQKQIPDEFNLHQI